VESVKDENARRVHLLACVVRTNEDSGLGPRVVLPDADGAALAMFQDVALQAPTFFASCSVVRAGGFTGAGPPICFRCLRWNLTAPTVRVRSARRARKLLLLVVPHCPPCLTPSLFFPTHVPTLSTSPGEESRSRACITTGNIRLPMSS
jgi:hypothetical protein